MPSPAGSDLHHINPPPKITRWSQRYEESVSVASGLFAALTENVSVTLLIMRMTWDNDELTI